MKINLKFSTTALLLSVALLLAGCNSTAGFREWQKDNEAFQKITENATKQPSRVQSIHDNISN